MKTILTLTDFSINAEYVAHYALLLAQHLKANLLVCNVYQDLEEKGPGVSPGAFGRAGEDSISDLGAVVAGLKKSLDGPARANSFRPDISQCSAPGDVDKKLNELAPKHDILLAVISTHSANNLSGDFRKNHAWAIIEKADVPVLVIPYRVRFKPYRNITFASALHAEEIPVLRSVAELAGPSDAAVLLTHVSPGTSGHQQEAAYKAFCDQIPAQVNYPNLSYINIHRKNVARALRETTADTAIDLLVLVHRRRSRLQQLFSGSIARKMLTRPYKPLLIFPGSPVKRSGTLS